MPDWAVQECNLQGYAVACHVRDVKRIAPMATHGYYACGERMPYWHGHTHDTCANGLDQHLAELLRKWPRDQKFATVSEAVLCSS